jgi:hypothetical protein
MDPVRRGLFEAVQPALGAISDRFLIALAVLNFALGAWLLLKKEAVLEKVVIRSNIALVALYALLFELRLAAFFSIGLMSVLVYCAPALLYVRRGKRLAVAVEASNTLDDRNPALARNVGKTALIACGLWVTFVAAVGLLPVLMHDSRARSTGFFDVTLPMLPIVGLVMILAAVNGCDRIPRHRRRSGGPREIR